MELTFETQSYINERLNQGLSYDQIKQELVSSGWDKLEADQVLLAYQSNQYPQRVKYQNRNHLKLLSLFLVLLLLLVVGIGIGSYARWQQPQDESQTAIESNSSEPLITQDNGYDETSADQENRTLESKLEEQRQNDVKRIAQAVVKYYQLEGGFPPLGDPKLDRAYDASELVSELKSVVDFTVPYDPQTERYSQLSNYTVVYEEENNWVKVYATKADVTFFDTWPLDKPIDQIEEAVVVDPVLYEPNTWPMTPLQRDEDRKYLSGLVITGLDHYYAINGAYPWRKYFGNEKVFTMIGSEWDDLNRKQWLTELVELSEISPEIAEEISQEKELLLLEAPEKDIFAHVCFLPESDSFKKAARNDCSSGVMLKKLGSKSIGAYDICSVSGDSYVCF